MKVSKSIAAIDYHAEALVIDLRNNPGGIVENATACISHFLRMPLMVKEYCLMTKNEVKSLRVEGRKEGGHANKRMYVLINEHTMSSAEYVFALIAKCYLGATLVGCQSAGISGQAQMFTINKAIPLKITATKYIGSDMRELRVGVMPDIVVLRDIEALRMNEDKQLAYLTSLLYDESGEG